MSYLSITLEREIKRMSVLRDVYEKQIDKLPKGSLRVKDRGGKKYFYLYYRRAGKVVSEYVGNDEAALADLKEQLARRKNIGTLLKSIKNELRLMNKALEMAR